MTHEDIQSVLVEVALWLAHPEAGDYRMIKLRLLLDKGYVDLGESIRANEEEKELRKK